MNDNNSFRIKQDVFTHLSLILVAVLFVAACLHLLTGDFSDSNFAQRVEWLIVPLGVAGLLFFSFATMYAIYRMFRFRYLLIIQKDGFIDYSTLGALGYTSWRDVENIRIYFISEHKLIGVTVENKNKILTNVSWYAKKLTKADIKAGYPPIIINLNSAKEKPEKVLAIMNQYWEEWKKNNEPIVK